MVDEANDDEVVVPTAKALMVDAEEQVALKPSVVDVDVEYATRYLLRSTTTMEIVVPESAPSTPDERSECLGISDDDGFAESAPGACPLPR